MSDRDITLREFLGHDVTQIEALQLQPGDVCVLRCTQPLSEAAVALIQQGWRSAFPGGAIPQLIILDSRMSLGVLRPQATAQGETASTSEPGK